MKVKYDLHIHSCLSPCGDNQMTPGNIVGMASLSGLSMIALSDHNTARNLPAVTALGKEMGLLVVPAIEITTAEEVHVLSLLPSLEAALELGEEVYSHLPPVQNRPDIFGDQLIMDEKDQVTGTLDKLLINATDLPIEKVFSLVRSYGGVPVPAHIDKNSNSILFNLGFISPELGVTAVEVHAPPFDGAEGYFVISDSDAHDLETFILHEPQELELFSVSNRALLRRLEQGREEDFNGKK